MKSDRTYHAPELLAPAGGPEPFAAALAAGADAIYCGMGNFNARRKATNFTDESFAEACRAAHLAGSRVYVTVNIVIKEREMNEALELVVRCWNLGADAFIIQDWGLFFAIRAQLPQIETHISTQANIHDARGTQWCKDAGADRVTLSRELSITEIARIHDAVPGIELEVFSHGAICFCYSGVCLLSSFAMAGRSANRGMCAQPCRLPYELVDEEGKLVSAPGRERALCPRDTNTSQLVGELVAAGASALKLEGRMKAPDYVYSIVDAYRHYIDALSAGNAEQNAANVSAQGPDAGFNVAQGNASSHGVSLAEDAALQRQLKRAFNRDFTQAYQHGTSGDEMMSYERSNNRGQLVGEVLGSRPAGINTRGMARDDKRRKLAIATISLFEPVGKGDLLELRHDDEFDQFLTTIAQEDAAAGSRIECRIPRAMPAGSRVRVIRSQAAFDAVDAALKRPVLRKRAVDVRVISRIDEPFTVSLSCCDNPAFSVSVTGFTVEPARTKAITSEDLIEHAGRMGSSPFEAASFDIELDEGCGMGFSAVHKVRTQACKLLEEAILAPYSSRDAVIMKEHGAHTQLGGFPGRHVNGAAEDRANASSKAIAQERSTRTSVATVMLSPTEASVASTLLPEQAAKICATAASLKAADAARTAGAELIYMATDALEAEGLTPKDAEAHGLTPILDEVCRAKDHGRIDSWIVPGAAVAVGNISELALAQELGAKVEIRSCIPMHNSTCAHELAARGARAFWLSPELSLDEIQAIGPIITNDRLNNHEPPALGITVYGRPRVMTSEHCILQVADRCVHDCARCKLRQQKLLLKNIDGKRFPVRTDIHGRSRLYEAAPIDITPQIPQLAAAGITRFHVDGTLMDTEELKRAVKRTVRAVSAYQAGAAPMKRQKGTTSGCLFVGVN